MPLCLNRFKILRKRLETPSIVEKSFKAASSKCVNRMQSCWTEESKACLVFKEASVTSTQPHLNLGPIPPLPQSHRLGLSGSMNWKEVDKNLVCFCIQCLQYTDKVSFVLEIKKVQSIHFFHVLCNALSYYCRTIGTIFGIWVFGNSSYYLHVACSCSLYVQLQLPSLRNRTVQTDKFSFFKTECFQRENQNAVTYLCCNYVSLKTCIIMWLFYNWLEGGLWYKSHQRLEWHQPNVS